MAKKNLASLMVGIMGDKSDDDSNVMTPYAPESDSAVAEHEINSTDIERVKEGIQSTPERTRRGPGRPRKGEIAVKSEEVRATFIVDPAHIKKIKYISLAEGCLLKDVVNAALDAYISSWEASNGKIRLPQKKNS